MKRGCARANIIFKRAVANAPHISDSNLSMKLNLEIVENRDDLAIALATRLATLASESLTAHSTFRLVLPGGSVISLLAQGLAQHPVDASRWELFWTDERCVPLNHSDSNFLLAQTHLFPVLQIPPARIHPIQGHLGPEAAARAYEDVLATVFGENALPQFDLILLGVGEDGHIASLFPGNPALLETTRAVAPVRHAPKPPPERVTLTLPVLHHARHTWIVASGTEKKTMLQRVCSPLTTESPLPTQLLYSSHGIVTWMIDRAAAPSTKDSP